MQLSQVIGSESWTGSWTGAPVEVDAIRGIAAQICGIRAGSVPGALGQATFRPLVMACYPSSRRSSARLLAARTVSG
jgi:hypothetical protein